MVAEGTPCLGPVTQAGCGAICPAHHRGCYGCFGPMGSPNVPALIPFLRRSGMSDGEVGRAFATFNVAAPASRRASTWHTTGTTPGQTAAGEKTQRKTR